MGEGDQRSFGRLARPPHPVLFAELYEGDFAKDQIEILPHLLEVDAAHVVMLAEVEILPRGKAAERLSAAYPG